MAHTIRDKRKIINRIRRIRGQVDSIEKAVLEEKDCSAILHTIAACRGAIGGLMVEVLEGHLRFHVVNPDLNPTSEQSQAAQEMIDVLRTYLR
jgi:FrmR/RcnR family transcriptional regulator, repressor of frmRAB operon